MSKTPATSMSSAVKSETGAITLRRIIALSKTLVFFSQQHRRKQRKLARKRERKRKQRDWIRQRERMRVCVLLLGDGVLMHQKANCNP
jgi:U3 small nucleolar ribonucleoprotein component